MPAQKKIARQTSASRSKPLAWWKKLALAVFGTYIAAKLFGILVPDNGITEFPSNTDRDRQQSIPNGPADESPDDTWDLPADDRCEEEHIHEDGTPPGFHLYDDWDDWGEGYDDDHFN